MAGRACILLMGAALVILPAGAGPAWGSAEGLQEHLAALERERPAGEGSGGDREVANYLARRLEALGAVPVPGSEGYVHHVGPPPREGSETPGARHVIGFLPVKEGAAGRPPIVLGSRYGRGGNPAGAAVLLEAGRRAAGQGLGAPVALAFWSGEVRGVNAVSSFLAALSSSGEAEGVGVYLGLDRVDRVRQNRLTLHGVGSSSIWPRLVEQANVVQGFDLRVEPDPRKLSDAALFRAVGVPAVGLLTDGTEEEARDLAELERVAHFAALLAGKLSRLDRRPDFVELERDRPSTRAPKPTSAYTGTKPDYAAGVEGLRLNGVIEGGPAEAAGLRKGDVIVEFDGKFITGVHDYARALEAVEVGRPIRVICERDGERIEVTLTPTARP